MKNLPQISFGIDIGKNFLDVLFHPINESLRVANDDTGIQQLFRKLKKYSIKQVVFEATGGYEYLLKKSLEKEAYTWWLVDPKRIRAFIVSEGIHAKTDKIDAQMIALFGSQKESTALKITVQKDFDCLHALTRRRIDLIKMISQEKNKIKHPAQKHCMSEITAHIKFLQNQVKSLDQQVDELIRNDNLLKEKDELITSVPGFGHVTSHVILAHLPELGMISNKKISALVGVAPIINQSGTLKGRATIRGGGAIVRRSIYMATIVSIRFNPILKAFYERLCREGKTCKIAIIATMRKLIVILNTMLQKAEHWHQRA